ncbi:MAG: LamG domain-containing protein [Planctomycetes bacterium]|nr:LamG domain-containing protein [Planctomycetota bacterium]
MRIRVLTICIAVFVGAAGSLPSDADEKPRGFGDLTGPWQLFVDDFPIESRSRLTRRYHAFQKHAENPLDCLSNKIGRGTVLPDADGAGYRKWVNANSLITSADGLNWTASVRLTRDSRESRGNISVIHTPWDRGREYKMIGTGYDPRQLQTKDPLNKGGGRYGSCSRDGIHWTELADAPLFRDRSDTGLFGWDPHRRRYFGTPKIWTHVRGFQRRCVGFSASEDFGRGWPTAELMLVPDVRDDRWVTKPGQRTEFYSLSAFAYESMYVGLLEVFHNTDGWKDGPIFIELVTSRDGLRWQRTAGEREPILPNGPSGSWDAGMIKVPNHPLIDGNSIRLYYYGSSETHGFGRKEYDTYGREDDRVRGLGLATLRKDGFASLDAGAETGTVTTRVLRNPGGALAVNYRASGWLRAEVLDGSGRPLPGYGLEDCVPLQGDSTNQTVRWEKHRYLPRRPLRLRFQMQNASLFSFSAGPDLEVERIEPELGVLFTFEGDPGTSATDRLAEDGSQGLYFHNAVQVDDNGTRAGRAESAAFGESEAMFLDPRSQHGLRLCAETAYQGRGAVPWSYLEIDGTFRLGEQFTLAACVKPKSVGTMRCFSAWEPYAVRTNEPPYERHGPVGMKELIFDFDSGGEADFGCLRLVVHGREIQGRGSFSDGGWHTIAATYDAGRVKLFLDGQEIGAGTVPEGPVTLLTNLHVGGDPGPLTSLSRGSASLAPLIGAVDDLLVVGRAMTTEELRRLSQHGATVWLEILEGDRRNPSDCATHAQPQPQSRP